ncbi:MAG TPA: redoxin family protein [Pyrinomonadaceae bacterium]|jgi:thioredoxin-related protein
MSTTYKRIELFANIAIILVAIILGIVMVKKFVLNDSAPAPNLERKQPEVGAKIALPDTDFSAKDKTLLMALRKDCHFCSESAEFYRKITGLAGEKNVRVIALFPHSVENGQEYLKQINVSIEDKRQADFAALNVSGTPTLILTDKNGEIKKVWVGKLPPEREKEVFESLQ